MKTTLFKLYYRVLVSLGIKPSEEELELDRICEEENQKVYKQLEIDLEAISKNLKVTNKHSKL